jgi:hypothetical protein
MPYQIDRYAGATLATVEDGTVDQTTNLKLVGKNYAGYGEIQNENFVHLLENFASANAPSRPLSGQIWFDSAANKLKFYDGVKFRTTGGAEIGTTQPAGLTTGDFWWDTANDQLYAYDGTGFVLVGPQGVGNTVTQLKSRTVKDNVGAGTPQAIIEATVDDEVVFIISNTEFTIGTVDPLNLITGFDRIRKGITMVNTLQASNGVTSSDHRFWGTAANALKLGGVDAANFLQVGGNTSFNDSGFTVGTGNDLRINIGNDGSTAKIINEVGTAVQMGASNTHSISITSTGIEPSADNVKDLGAVSKKFNNVYATNFLGTATTATNVNFASVNYPGSTSSMASSVALRDGSGNLAANIFNGVATSARYADLAEKYLADAEYPVGTVMAIGGAKEITAATINSIVAGVVSGAPAFLMNAELQSGTAVAIKGRVPVLVKGAVAKGDKIGTSSTAGIGAVVTEGDYFAVALEADARTTNTLVECFIK